MKKLNRKGFTLIEVLAVIVIIAIVGGIAIPNIMSTINSGKTASENTMIENIKTASEQLYKEIEYMDVTLYKYDNDGKTDDKIEIKKDENYIEVNLQTLVSNGFLSGTGKDENNAKKKIFNPKTNEDIGDCIIKITKIVDGNKTTYKVEPKVEPDSKDSKCPQNY